jgi:sulfite reductase beta subunit-like hemoprotein
VAISVPELPAPTRFINDRVHANIQKDGTFSVVPRMRGGVTSASELRRIADVAEKYNVPMIKVTGSQRLDLLGIKKEDLPKVWADLGMPSGQAYAKIIPCDSCFIYVLEQDLLVLRASRNPHDNLVDHLAMQLGQGITGWVAEHREPVSVPSHALRDPRFKSFHDLPEDRFEAMLAVPIQTAGKVVGVINLQHQKPYQHSVGSGASALDDWLSCGCRD